MLGLGNSISRSDFTQSASLLLDRSFAAGPSAAYSLRRLSSEYSGPVVQIRRASDNVEVNVNFDSDGVVSLNSTISNVTEETTGSSTSLTTSAKTLGQFVANASYTDADSLGSTDSALVQCWYDQSGNSNDVIQSTAGTQPQIISSGSLVVDNGKPTITFSNTTGNMTGYTPTSGDISFFMVANSADTTASHAFGTQSWTGTSSGRWFIGCNTTFRFFTDPGTDQITANITQGQMFLGSAFQISGNKSIFSDGSAGGTSTGASTSWTGSGVMSNTAASRGFSGTISEMIIYQSDQSSNRTDIEADINTFYSIF